jgi:hypothetical protein
MGEEDAEENIFRGTRTEDGGWQRKTNREIKELYRHNSTGSL